MKSTILTAASYFGGECKVEFTETGYTVLCDTRECKDGYLHITAESAAQITEACRNTIIKYFYGHGIGEPGIGATAQDQYFAGLTRKDREEIGANGKTVYYNR